MSSSADMTFGIGIIIFYLFLIGLALLGTIFWIVELIDVSRREFPASDTKIVWILVIVFLHGLGALLYYFIGKPQGWLPGQRTPYYSQPPPQDHWPPPPGT